MKICIDASLIVKWLVPEDDSPQALSLYRGWLRESFELVAPALVDYEVASTLRQKVVRGLLQLGDVYPAIDFYHRLNITRYHLADAAYEAIALATALEQATVYDVSYLLLAKNEKIDFVTADEKFCKASSSQFPFVKYYRSLVG